MSKRVLVIAGLFARAGDGIREAVANAGLELVNAPVGGPWTEDDLPRILDGFDAVIAGMEPYTEKVLSALPRLRAIVRWGVGFDSIDLAAATRHGKLVLNTPGVLHEAVADHAFALILAMARRLRDLDNRVRSGGWGGIEGLSLTGKTLGIVGLGEIGRCVARRAQGFGMRLIGCDPRPNQETIEALGITLTSLEGVLREADFVTLHANTTPQNAGMIGEAALRSMKPTAYLINTARGALVDQTALTRALMEGWIAGAGLDVLAPEPPEPDDPLLSLPNCLVTPHCASATLETVDAVNEVVGKNLIEAFSGERPRFLVNTDVWR